MIPLPRVGGFKPGTRVGHCDRCGAFYRGEAGDQPTNRCRQCPGAVVLHPVRPAHTTAHTTVRDTVTLGAVDTVAMRDEGLPALAYIHFGGNPSLGASLALRVSPDGVVSGVRLDGEAAAREWCEREADLLRGVVRLEVAR